MHRRHTEQIKLVSRLTRFVDLISRNKSLTSQRVAISQFRLTHAYTFAHSPSPRYHTCQDCTHQHSCAARYKQATDPRSSIFLHPRTPQHELHIYRPFAVALCLTSIHNITQQQDTNSRCQTPREPRARAGLTVNV